MLEVQKVSKRYENQRGVFEIDFGMQRGEIVGFLGPNGAGKTTTMRMITGYLSPTSGSIRVDGMSMSDDSKKVRRKIGYLPETPPIYPEMSVQSYLKFVADLRDVPVREQRQRIGEAIEKLGLQGRERQIIRSLSKGYKQRVGLAQAIVHKPDLLILDEPTSGLDPKQIIEIRKLIQELGDNHTVLLSTHILPEVNAICNRVLIISGGRIVMDGRPDELGRQMGETFEVSLEVRGPRDRIVAAVSPLGTVKDVTVPAPAGADEASAPVRLRVVSHDASDIREALFYRLAEERLPLLEMKRESLSLEDIFLKLTTEERAVDAAETADADAAAAVDSATVDTDSTSADADLASPADEEVNGRA